jgi:hypothetical protein
MTAPIMSARLAWAPQLVLGTPGHLSRRYLVPWPSFVPNDLWVGAKAFGSHPELAASAD